ncbi:MAG: hypothetical protein NTW08_06420 [Gammaproteobacteria bacterium]|nr:hypothetical protein [Gammaproteobacteria bacterium]
MPPKKIHRTESAFTHTPIPPAPTMSYTAPPQLTAEEENDLDSFRLSEGDNNHLSEQVSGTKRERDDMTYCSDTDSDDENVFGINISLQRLGLPVSQETPPKAPPRESLARTLSPISTTAPSTTPAIQYHSSNK